MYHFPSMSYTIMHSRRLLDTLIASTLLDARKECSNFTLHQIICLSRDEETKELLINSINTVSCVYHIYFFSVETFEVMGWVYRQFIGEKLQILLARYAPIKLRDKKIHTAAVNKAIYSNGAIFLSISSGGQ